MYTINNWFASRMDQGRIEVTTNKDSTFNATFDGVFYDCCTGVEDFYNRAKRAGLHDKQSSSMDV